MGYRCPVCDTPQRDAGHLADHLAFTAMLRGEDHEEWLDERVTDWEELGTETLAERVVGYAPEAEFEAVFEDTTGGPHTHAHDHGRDPTHATEGGRPDVNGEASVTPREAGGTGDVDAGAARDRFDSAGAGDAEVQSALREAREMTQQMLDGAGDDDGDAASTDDGSAEAHDADEEKES